MQISYDMICCDTIMKMTYGIAYDMRYHMTTLLSTNKNENAEENQCKSIDLTHLQIKKNIFTIVFITKCHCQHAHVIKYWYMQYKCGKQKAIAVYMGGLYILPLYLYKDLHNNVTMPNSNFTNEMRRALRSHPPTT